VHRASADVTRRELGLACKCVRIEPTLLHVTCDHDILVNGPDIEPEVRAGAVA